MLRIAVPNKGTLSSPAAEMLREAGYRQRTDDRTWSAATPTTTSSSSTCARATSPSTSAPATSTSASPAGTCWSTPAAPADELLDLGFGGATFRFAARPATVTHGRRDRRARGSPPRTRAWSSATSPTRHRGRGDPARRRGRERGPARRGRRDRRRRPDRRHAAPGRPGVGRRADPELVGGAGPPGRAPSRRRRSPSCVRRLQGVLVARRYVMLAYDVRADLLEHATALTPGHRVADGLAAAPRGLGGGAGDGAAHATCTGSWTSCTTWAPARSWSPTSTPAASDRLCRPLWQTGLP